MSATERSGLMRLRTMLAALSVLTLTACGGPVTAVTEPPGVPAGAPCGTVTIAVNPWAGYAANVAVVAYLLRTELGCTVRTTDLTEGDSWAGLAAGTVDVILENWGHNDLRKKYIDDRKVAVSMGLTGNKGIIGWYVPSWMTDEYPDITDWRSLDGYADLFRTGQSGDRGQFLAGDPSFVTQDAALIKNLELDFDVVYTGSEERLIQAFRRAQQDRKPLLGYFYEPQWLLSEIKLAQVTLPRYRPGCDIDPKTVACGYPAYDLDKVARVGFLRSGSPAVDLVQNFRWTNADQNSVARDLTVRGLRPDAAARIWLDAHRGTWQEWVPRR